MHKSVILFLLAASLLWSAAPKDLLGEWQLRREFASNGERHLELEDLTFMPDTFRLILTVTIRKGNLLVDRLRIQAGGLWKLKGDTLVLVMQEIRFLGVERTDGIDRNSFEKLIRDLRGRYLSDPIRILRLDALGGTTLTLRQDGESKNYRRP
jgi:hypothetical protein